MKSAVFYSPNNIKVVEKKMPKLTPDSIIVKVKACAICGSDLRIFKEGNKRIVEPRILGHEISGEIVEVGHNVEGFKVLDRVSTGADLPCGNCKYCKDGKPNSCAINYAVGYQFDGGFSEFVIFNDLLLKGGPIQKFTSSTGWNEAALAEPLACCLNGFQQALVKQEENNETLLIFGAGPIGLMLLLLGKNLFNFNSIIVIEPSEFRRDAAKLLGADHLINPACEDIKNIVLDLTNGQGVNVIFTACPILETHKISLELIDNNGVINFFGGLPQSSSAIEILSNLIHYKQIYITGSHGSTPEQHCFALHLIKNNIVDVKPLISKVYKLEDINKGFSLAASGKVSKVVICP